VRENAGDRGFPRVTAFGATSHEENSVTFLKFDTPLRVFASSREIEKGFTRRRKGAKFALLLASLLANPAWAQEILEEPEDIDSVHFYPHLRIDLIVTAIGTEQIPETTGQSVTTIGRWKLEERQTVSVAELLSTTPGVTVSRNGGPGKATAVRIRGAEDSQTLTLIDGVRVNDPSSPGGAFDFGNLLAGNIARIEVLRGPNSVPWGSQAIGGVVNIVTAKPTDDFSGNARAEYGFENRAQLVGTVSDTFGPISASIGGGYFKDDGISVFKDGTERDGFRQYAANGKVGVELSDNFDLDFRVYYASGKTQGDGFPPPFFSFADTPEFSKSKELFAYSGANLRLFDSTFKNRLSFTVSDINRDNFDAPAQATPSFLARGRVERFEYQGDASLSEYIRTVFGAEHEISRFTDGFAPAKTSVSSGYGQIIAQLADTLTLTGGARVDDHKDFGTATTFSANAAWRPSSDTIIRASYGEGFKAPTLFQLNSFFGNKALKPEAAKSYDLGVEQRLIGGTLTVGVTAFLRNTTNQIGFDFSAARPSGFYNNIDRTRAKGIETFIRARPTNKLTFEANYSLIDSKNRNTGETLLRRPKHSINASIDWTAQDWLKLGADIQSVSRSRDFDFVTFNPTALEGYTLTTLRAALPIGETLELYGRVENLFDVGYETVSGYGTLGRNAHIGVRAKF
jgi:vitamin B12 transporter